MRHILTVINSRNNLMFHFADFAGNTKFFYTAKAAKFKSKQVRRTIVIETLWQTALEKLKNYSFTHLTLKLKGAFLRKRYLFKQFKKKPFRIVSLDQRLAVPFNGCKVRHQRRK